MSSNPGPFHPSLSFGGEGGEERFKLNCLMDLHTKCYSLIGWEWGLPNLSDVLHNRCVILPGARIRDLGADNPREP